MPTSKLYRLGWVAGSGLLLLLLVALLLDLTLLLFYVRHTQQDVNAAAQTTLQQMERGASRSTLELTARQYLRLRGYPDAQVRVETCSTARDLCNDEMARVRLLVQLPAPTLFLHLIEGRRILRLSAESPHA